MDVSVSTYLETTEREKGGEEVGNTWKTDSAQIERQIDTCEGEKGGTVTYSKYLLSEISDGSV